MLVFRELNKSLERKNSIFFGGFDDDYLFGICIMEIEEQNAELIYLYIEPDYRNDKLGDALLKSTLNKLDKIGVKYVSYSETNDYLLKVGFKKSENNHIYLELPSFFENQCNKCRR